MVPPGISTHMYHPAIREWQHKETRTRIRTPLASLDETIQNLVTMSKYIAFALLANKWPSQTTTDSRLTNKRCMHNNKISQLTSTCLNKREHAMRISPPAILCRNGRHRKEFLCVWASLWHSFPLGFWNDFQTWKGNTSWRWQDSAHMFIFVGSESYFSTLKKNGLNCLDIKHFSQVPANPLAMKIMHVVYQIECNILVKSHMVNNSVVDRVMCNTINTRILLQQKY